MYVMNTNCPAAKIAACYRLGSPNCGSPYLMQQYREFCKNKIKEMFRPYRTEYCREFYVKTSEDQIKNSGTPAHTKERVIQKMFEDVIWGHVFNEVVSPHLKKEICK